MKAFMILARDRHSCLVYMSKEAQTPEQAVDWFIKNHGDMTPLEIICYTHKFEIKSTSAFTLTPIR